MNIKDFGLDGSIILKMWATILSGCIVLTYVIFIAAHNDQMPELLKSALSNNLLKAHISTIFYLVIAFAIWFLALVMKCISYLFLFSSKQISNLYNKTKEKIQKG